MFRCSLLEPGGGMRHLETTVLGDTNLATAAAMVADEIGNRTQADEIYFFGIQNYTLSPERAYYICSQNGVDNITPDRLASYLTNIVDYAPPSKFSVKKKYEFNDLIELGLEGKRELRVPLSISVNAEARYPVPANPYNWVSEDPTISANAEAMISHRGGAVIFDTALAYPMLYCCTAKDVLNTTQNPAIIANLARIYFPLMAARGIRSPAALRAAHADAITPTPTSTQDRPLAILTFSDITQNPNVGATDFTVVFHPDIPINLPLELIFRSVPASDKLPFIKLNMGKGRSRLFRLYTPPAADGVKRPALGTRQISRLQTAIAMQEGVGYAVLAEDALCTLDMYPNGNLRVRLVARYPVRLDDLESRINQMLGEAFLQINKALEDTGYQYPTRFSLESENVEVLGVRLRGKRTTVERFNPSPVTRCITDVMFTTDVGDSIAELVYHRVGYYNNLTAVENYITMKLRQSQGISEVVRGVERGFGLSHDSALEAVQTWASKAQEELNAHANQRLKVVTSGGVKVILTRDRLSRTAEITAEGTISLDQAILLSRYMESIIAASTTTAGLERFTEMIGDCSSAAVTTTAAAPAPSASSAEFIQSHTSPLAAQAASAELSAPTASTAMTVANNRIVVDDDEDDNFMDDLLDMYGDMGDAAEEEEVQERELDELLGDQPPEEELTRPGRVDSVHGPTPATPAVSTPGVAAAAASTPVARLSVKSPLKGADVVGMKLKAPNYFHKRMADRDPNLFVTSKSGKFTTYSRLCAHNLRRQPVVLTQEEKERMEREAPDSFDPSSKALLQYSSGSGPPNWYMCPRYWCLKTDLPMTQAQVDAGECGGKIIPYSAGKVPDDAFIYEFNSYGRNNEHVNADGSYAQHHPGFLDSKNHPDGLCMPCCFKDVDNAKMQKRISMCTGRSEERAQEASKENKRTSRLYVKDPNKYPLAAGDIGFLTPVVQKLLGTDNSKCTVSERDKTIVTNVRCVLRGGVEGNEGRSMLNAVAVAANIPLDTLIEKLAEAVNTNSIAQLQSGTLVKSLVPLFQTTTSSLPLATETERAVASEELRKVAVERLRQMLRDPQTAVGYQYIWDLVRLHAFDEPVNLLVLLLDEEDGSDNVKLLCPEAASGSRQHDPNRGTLVLLRKQGFYEPVMMYRSSAAGGEAPLAPVERLLGAPNTKMPEVKTAIDNLGAIADGCGRTAVRAQTAPTRQEVEEAVSKRGGRVRKLVANFTGRLVAVQVELGDGQRVTVPVEAEAMPEGGNGGTELTLIGGVDTMLPLNETLDGLDAFSRASELRMEPYSVMSENGQAVAVLTQSDRVIPVLPSSLTGSEDGMYRGLRVVEVPTGGGPVEAEAESVLGAGQDDARLAAAAAIQAHTETYELFRAWLRAQLLNSEMVGLRRAITMSLKQQITVGEKLKLLARVLRDRLGSMVHVVSARGSTPIAVVDTAGIFYIPEGLFTIDDIMLRAADELVRYPNAAKFILGRTMFYSSQPGEYQLAKDEMVVPEAMLISVRDLSTAGLMQGLVGPSVALSTNTEPQEEAFVSESPPSAAAPTAATAPTTPAPAAPVTAAPVASVTTATPILTPPPPPLAPPAPTSPPVARASPKPIIPKNNTSSGCAVYERRNVNSHDKLRVSRLVPPDATLITPEANSLCLWEMLGDVISANTEQRVTGKDLRKAVARGYRLLGEEDAEKAAETWRAEGKIGFANMARPITGASLAGTVHQVDYYPTNIDLYYLSIAYGLSIVIASSHTNKHTGTEYIVYGRKDSKVVLLKRGKQFRNKPMIYMAVTSPGGLTLRTILPALATVIENNRLPNPYHERQKKINIMVAQPTLPPPPSAAAAAAVLLVPSPAPSPPTAANQPLPPPPTTPAPPS